MSARRCCGLVIAGAIVALWCAPAWGQVAAGRRGDPTDQTPAASGVSPPGGVRSEGTPVRLSFRGIVDDAFPRAVALGGVKSKAPRRISGLPRPIKGLLRPRFPMNTRAGWITGWPRIPDLPQVKAKIPVTNRIVSRAEAERKKATERPAAPRPKDPRAPQEQQERDQRLREAARTGDTETVRTIRVRETARRAEFERTIDRVNDRDNEREDPCRQIEGRALDGSRDDVPDGRLLADGSDASLTPRERADRLVRAGEYERAADAYLAQLDADAGDADAARSLAVALLLAGKPNHAADAIVEAYRIDPGVAARAFDASVLPADVSLRSLVTRSITKANTAKTAGAWLLAAVLVQAEGRRDVAARLVERARAAGLDGPIADAFVAALSKEATHATVGGS